MHASLIAVTETEVMTNREAPGSLRLKAMTQRRPMIPMM